MAARFPPCPPQLRVVQHYLKLASDYEARNNVISYWARLYSLQTSLKIDKKSPEAKALLIALMDWLEVFKKSNSQNESITSDVAGQAMVENEANKLFVKADTEDRASHFNKNTVKLFYTAGTLFDVCEVFGELTEDVASQRKYSKWKATYIHNCLKNGETPLPGPIGGDEDEVINEETPQPRIPDPSENNSGAGFTLPPIHHAEPQEPEPSQNSHIAQAHGYIPEGPPATEASVSTVDMVQAQKFCKFAISALDYEDSKTAIENLQKALALLTQ